MTQLRLNNILHNDMTRIDRAEGTVLDSRKRKVGARREVDQMIDRGRAVEGVEEIERDNELSFRSEAEKDCCDAVLDADLLNEDGVGDVAVGNMEARTVVVFGKLGCQAFGIAGWKDKGWVAWVLKK